MEVTGDGGDRGWRCHGMEVTWDGGDWGWSCPCPGVPGTSSIWSVLLFGQVLSQVQAKPEPVGLPGVTPWSPTGTHWGPSSHSGESGCGTIKVTMGCASRAVAEVGLTRGAQQWAPGCPQPQQRVPGCHQPLHHARRRLPKG